MVFCEIHNKEWHTKCLDCGVASAQLNIALYAPPPAGMTEEEWLEPITVQRSLECMTCGAPHEESWVTRPCEEAGGVQPPPCVERCAYCGSLPDVPPEREAVMLEREVARLRADAAAEEQPPSAVKRLRRWLSEPVIRLSRGWFAGLFLNGVTAGLFLALVLRNCK